ncbi:PLP-dependent aminotransferase family protein [Nocardiopsis sp. YSL2]|uniref:MocR-like pyridoxine biosynthesis transcription factor PdxR n=1 Tax=Nocardiopsis sp. YSL2 TaxID=2939492 RepID=UPI0026F46FBB|nr:PLP-dependent aminotransferase family protein [Nocardiopsis sp. YSL2]
MNRSKKPSENRSTTVGADFLQLDPAHARPGHLTDWLTDHLRQALTHQRLGVGSRLPATRTLAADLGVSRGVVTEAYRRLTDEGHLTARGRGGTVVASTPAAPATTPAQDHTPLPALPADPGTDIFDRLRHTPARHDLTPGTPDLAAFPRTAWLRAERTVLAQTPTTDLGYTDPRGHPRLRTALAHHLARYRRISVHPDHVQIVSGTAQALALLGQLLHQDGVDTLALEDPGSLGIRQHLHHARLRTPPVPVDEHGADIAALTATGAPAVLLTPAHQFPTGAVLSGPRRRLLLDWAKNGGLVIEDDYDAEHRYDRAPVPALHSLLPDRVCYTGSVSKLLAPALRLGWVLAPPRHRDRLTEAKRFSDLGSPVLPQLVLAHLIESGTLERHLRQIRARHRRRRDTMTAALATHLPGATVHGAAAGLHLMLTFAPGLDDTALARAALARGVRTHPLSWHRQRPGPPGLVLGYAAATGITQAVTELGHALRQTT